MICIWHSHPYFLTRQLIWILLLQNPSNHQTSSISRHVRFHVTFMSLFHPCFDILMHGRFHRRWLNVPNFISQLMRGFGKRWSWSLVTCVSWPLLGCHEQHWHGCFNWHLKCTLNMVSVSPTIKETFHPLDESSWWCPHVFEGPTSKPNSHKYAGLSYTKNCKQHEIDEGIHVMTKVKCSPPRDSSVNLWLPSVEDDSALKNDAMSHECIQLHFICQAVQWYIWLTHLGDISKASQQWGHYPRSFQGHKYVTLPPCGSHG